MENIKLKFLLKLLKQVDKPTSIGDIYLNKGTNVSEKRSIGQEFKELELIDCTEEVAKIKITAAGKALLKIDEANQELTKDEIKILQACKDRLTLPKDTKVTPAATRQELITKLTQRGLIEAQTIITKVWLTEKGKQYLARDYDPRGGGNINLSKNMLADYLDHLRRSFATKTIVTKPTDTAILAKIVELDREYNTDNYLPIFHLRNELQPSLSRVELDAALYRLQAEDKLDLSTLAEVDAYTPTEINAGIPQPVGGALFFVTVN